MDYLDEIMHRKRQEMAERARPVRESELARWAEQKSAGLTFYQALADSDELSVIAEIKRRSPSAGSIAETVSVAEQARRYYNAAADAVSVLTDEQDFGGTLQDLWDVTDFMATRDDPCPCLRKDFMVHPLQVLEAAEAGAQAILLIVRALSDDELKSLYETANIAGLDSLFEIHSESELERALLVQPRIIGVNNRDLSCFTTDLSVSAKLLPQIPEDVVSISESGVHSPEDAQYVREAGADAVLIGEALMRAESPEAFIKAVKAV